MDDVTFLDRIREKIETRTGEAIELELDEESPFRMEVVLTPEAKRVVLGRGVLEYPGFARMCVEYAVAAIRAGRPLDPLEFHILLRRN